MPPHLHPRSTATSTLFAGTLLASFIVVGIPHVFPCPRPRTGYADAEMRFVDEGNVIQQRRVRGRGPAGLAPGVENRKIESDKAPPKSLTQTKNLQEEAALFRELQREAEILDQQDAGARECPVPKPRGVLGRWLGFEEREEVTVVAAEGKS